MPATEMEAENIGALAVRVQGLERRFTDELKTYFENIDKIRGMFVQHTAEIQEIKLAATEYGKADLRIKQLETQMDDLPSRTTALETLSIKGVQNLPVLLEKFDNRLLDLESKPKEQAAAEDKRQRRLLMWAGIGGCLYMLVSAAATIVLGGVGIALSILLAHH